MRSYKPVFYSCILLLLLSGCNPLEQSSQDWSAALIVSGGIAGLIQEISIDQSGRAVLLDKRKKSETSEQLSSNELNRLASQLQALSGVTASVKRHRQCRDCIMYSLITTYAGNQQRWVTDNLSIQQSEARELIQSLTGLAARMGKK